MNLVSISNSLVQQIPWFSDSNCMRLMATLIHSLWQASVIAAVFSVAPFGFRRNSSNARYWSGVFAMGMVVLSSLVTFGLLSAVYETPGKVAETRPLLPVRLLSTDEVLMVGTNTERVGEIGISAAASRANLPGRSTLLFVNFAPRWVCAFYLMGVAVMLSRLAVSVAAGYHIRLKSVEVVDDRIKDIVRRLAK